MTWLQLNRESEAAGRSARPARSLNPWRAAGVALATIVVATTLLAGVGQAQIVINEVRYRDSGGGNSNQIVELKNTGASPANIGGWIFCHQFNYDAVLPANFTIPSGGFAQMHFHQSGVNTSTDVYFSGANDILADVTDLALYATANFPSSSAIRAFIQFGGHPSSGRESVAQAAGLWTSGQFIPAVASGHSIELCSGSPSAVTSYVEQSTPTFGQENGCGVPVKEISWTRLKGLFH